MKDAVRKEMVETPAETARRRHEAMTPHSAANPEQDQSDTRAQPPSTSSHASFRKPYPAPAGTKIYASPELSAGEPIDNRSDIWSLGVIIGDFH